MAEPIKSQSARAPTEADIRAENLTPQLRRHTWINIAGPIAAVFLGIFAAAMYLRPVDVLRWIQISRLGWSGVSQNDLALKDGMITYLMTGGYSEMEPVVMIHGLGPNAALVWRGIMPPVADAHYKVICAQPARFRFVGSQAGSIFDRLPGRSGCGDDRRAETRSR